MKPIHSLRAGAFVFCASALFIAAPIAANAAGIFPESVEPRDVSRREREAAEKVVKSGPVDPLFSEYDFLLETAQREAALPGPGFLRDARYAFPAGSKLVPVASVPGQAFYDVEHPPKNRHWWKVPVYAITGAPRDLIDGIFGVASKLPVINIVGTGAYEFSGAQFLMRHPDDVHVYGGLEANENKHGWGPEGDGWGWFSNFQRTDFVETDTAELERQKKHNEELEKRLDASNKTLESQNEGIESQAGAYFERAFEAYRAGRTEEAVAMFYNYSQNRPGDYRARAYYLIGIMQLSIAQPQWTVWSDQQIRRELATWPAGSYSLLAQALREHVTANPTDMLARYWETFVFTKIGSYGEAVASGRQLSGDPRSDMKDHILYFEVCLKRVRDLDAKVDPDAIKDLLRRMEYAIERMKRVNASLPDTLLAQARYDVMIGKYDAGLGRLAELAQRRAGESRFPYYYGAGLMLQGLYSDRYDEAAAVAALTKARDTAQSGPRREAAEAALVSARNIKAKASLRPPEMAD